MGVAVHAVKKLLELIESQIADHLAETLVALGSSWLPVGVLPHADGFNGLYRFHANVKSRGYKNLPPTAKAGETVDTEKLKY
jgi:hypothetical protein